MGKTVNKKPSWLRHPKIAEYGLIIKLNPGDKWKCPCGIVDELDAFVAAHWHNMLEHTCDCGVQRFMKNGRMHTPEKKVLSLVHQT
jgi:hypothetical protein